MRVDMSAFEFDRRRHRHRHRHSLRDQLPARAPALVLQPSPRVLGPRVSSSLLSLDHEDARQQVSGLARDGRPYLWHCHRLMQVATGATAFCSLAAFQIAAKTFRSSLCAEARDKHPRPITPSATPSWCRRQDNRRLVASCHPGRRRASHLCTNIRGCLSHLLRTPPTHALSTPRPPRGNPRQLRLDRRQLMT